MDEAQYIREQIRQAREYACLSQREMADLLGTTQASISDIERGRVQVNAAQLSQIAEVLGKPVTYFYPPSREARSELEIEALRLIRSVSERWQQRMLEELESQAKLYRRLLPYERAGIPEEFYERLLFEEMDSIRLQEMVDAGILIPPYEEEDLEAYRDFMRRYSEWKEEADTALEEKGDLQ